MRIRGEVEDISGWNVVCLGTKTSKNALLI